MKLRFSHQQNHALTLTEVLVVIAVLAVLAVVFIVPAVYSYTQIKPAKRIHCVSNLKQVSIACRIWAGDHSDKYPMAVSTTNGGAMEVLATGNVAAGFQVMSDELSMPNILHCPADTTRIAAANFATGFSDANISYFVGLDATNDNNQQMFLSGDDNFAINGVLVKSGVRQLPTNTQVTWTAVRHKLVGNIGMADGHVEQANTDELQKALQQTGVATNRLVIP